MPKKENFHNHPHPLHPQPKTDTVLKLQKEGKLPLLRHPSPRLQMHVGFKAYSFQVRTFRGQDVRLLTSFLPKRKWENNFLVFDFIFFNVSLSSSLHCDIWTSFKDLKTTQFFWLLFISPFVTQTY